MANWSELPNDILESLTSLLPLPDYHRFGAVCQNWWSIAKQKHHRPAHQLPWLVLWDDGATRKRTFFNLSENRHYYIDIPELQGKYLCGSSFGWLFTVDNRLNCRLLNPFTGKQYDLPPLPPYKNNDMSINEYLIEPREDWLADLQNALVWKAILDHDPSEVSDFKVVIIYGDCGDIALWKSGDLTWNFIEEGCSDDVMFFKGRLYGFSLLAENILYVMDDWSDMKITEVNISNSIPKYPETASCAHLVDFNGELLLVQMYLDYNEGYRTTIDIKVDKIDLKGGVSFGCKHIDGYAIFLGMCSAVVVDPRKFPSCRKNAIYFIDKSAQNASKYGRDDLVIYDMDRCMFMRYYQPDIFISEIASPIWFNPNPW